MKPKLLLYLVLVLGGCWLDLYHVACAGLSVADSHNIERAAQSIPPGLPIEFQSIHMIDRDQGRRET
jgi:hypothetical protein